MVWGIPVELSTAVVRRGVDNFESAGVLNRTARSAGRFDRDDRLDRSSLRVVELSPRSAFF